MRKGLHRMINRQRTLKSTYLLSGLAICLISLLLASGTSYTVSYSVTAGQSNERIRQTAMKSAAELDTWFLQYGCVVEGIAEDIEAAGIVDRAEVLRLMQAKFAKYTPEVLDFYVGFEDRALVSGLGWVPEATYDCRTRDWYTKAAAAKSVVYTEPYIDAQTGKMVITISRAFMRKGRVVGVVAADIFTTHVVSIVNRHDIAGSEYAFLLNAKSDIIVHPTKDYQPSASGFKNASTVGDPALRVLGEALRDGKLGLVEAKVRGGATKYFMLSEVRSCGWFFCVAIDSSAYRRPLDTLLYGFLAALVASTITGVLIMLRFVRGMLEPIRSLSETVKRFSAERMDVRASVDSADELGELGRSFNRMADTIQDYSRSLELKVAERTRELKEKNDKIMESIDYAERLQRAALPPLAPRLGLSEEDCFVIWRPRDVVGGDTYWCRSEDERSLLILADCTGHGVPGALMTMAIQSILDGMPRSLGNARPSEIARYVHERLRETLRQESSDSLANDGADLAICLIDRAAGRLRFCGAHMSLFVESAGRATEHRGHQSSVGYADRRAVAFVDEDVALEPGSVFYLTTDGLLDQNEAAGRGGLGRRGFASFVAAQGGLSMREREAGILRLIERRLAGADQRDDITVIGFTLR
jgi:serine phosphatase RsbU (regulator of sigma subunit)/HAMP domain-containing protein